MSTNLYFNNFAHQRQQWLIEDLIIESIKMYGIDVCYMPRTLVAEDHLFGEDALSQFNEAYSFEAYVKSIDGFSGDGDFLSKFGLEIRDQLILTIAQRRFHEEIDKQQSTPVGELGIDRPSEGDLIMFPLNGKIFEVKFVEHEAMFYQMGKLQTYDLTLELFEFSHEQFNTGVTEIDAIEEKFSADVNFYGLLMEDGSNLVFEDGSGSAINDAFRIENTDEQANNEYFTVQTSDPDYNFIDWSESNPFGEI